MPSGEASALAKILTSRPFARASAVPSPTLSSASATAARSIESRITAWPITNGLSEAAELPITMTTLCMNSMPAEDEATEENKFQSFSTWSSPTVGFDFAQRRGDAERGGAARIAHRRIAARGHGLAAAMQRRLDALAGQQRTLDLHEMHVARIVDAGVAHGQMHRVDGLFDLRLAADLLGQEVAGVRDADAQPLAAARGRCRAAAVGISCARTR